MKLRKIWNIGETIYNCRKKPKHYRQLPVFIIRCLIHKNLVNQLNKYFEASELKTEFADMHPWIWAQLTRSYFYRNSSAAERFNIIKNSWDFMNKSFSDSALRKIYCNPGSGLILWEHTSDDTNLSLEMYYEDGESKEGCMTLFLKSDSTIIYHINLWFMPDNGSDSYSAYIGCHQGHKDGLDINRNMTKVLFGCRPKNLIFIAVQHLLKSLGITKLYAVSNYGFYANTQIFRIDRKLKVSYDEFWQECLGQVSPDKRFYLLPLDENRKSYEEIPTKKRAYYRKRYELLNQISEAIHKKVMDNKKAS